MIEAPNPVPAVIENLLHLPETLDAASATLLVLAAAGTSALGAMFGVGGGTLLLAALALLLPPAALIPIHAVVQFTATAGRAAVLVRHIVRPPLLPFAVGTTVGSLASGAVFVQLPAWLVLYAVAAFILWSVSGRMPVPAVRHVFAAGAFSGFLTVFVGATGPFVAAFVKGMRLDRLAQVGTHAALMALQHALKIVVFGLLGFSFAPYTSLLVLMVAGAFAGTLVGRSVLVRIPETRFRVALNVVLVIVALRVAWTATEYLLGIESAAIRG